MRLGPLPLTNYSQVGMNQPSQPKGTSFININLETLTEWCGIRPDEIGMGDWLTDKNLPIVDANEAMDQMNLETSKFEGEPTIKFTFQSAVRLVVAIINRNAKLKEDAQEAAKDRYIPLFFPAAGGYLLRALSCVKTTCPELIAKPPQYPSPVCSADSRNHDYWLGAILQMLYEQNHITAYGYKGCDFWFCK